MGIGPIQKKRKALMPQAQGRVLEIGVGTGHNMPFYDSDRVTELIAIDPAEQMHGKAQERADAAGIAVRVLGVPAETIPLEDGSVDTVVTTFTLCSIPDAAAALAEMRQVAEARRRASVLRAGAAPTAGVRTWQRRLNPIQRRIAGGRHLDRDMPGLLRSRRSRSRPSTRATSPARRSSATSSPAPLAGQAQPIDVPAERRFSQASTTRAAMPASAALPQARGS